MPSTPLLGAASSNTFLNAIHWGGWRWDDGAPAGTDITYFFRAAGTSLNGFVGAGAGDSVAWTEAEKTAYRAAVQSWANVANITFTEVFVDGQADLKEFIYNQASDTLGIHETPQHAFNIDGSAWGAYNRQNFAGGNSLNAGGFDFITFVHEVGHALGLAHPHDNGGGSSFFPGVNDSGDLGDNDLNQGIFTTMSYLDGWRTGPSGNPASDNFGWQSGPMAFDIAAIQFLYGANTNFNTGNETYVLPDVNANGTFWSCIWDAGGVDQIAYGGSKDTVISLIAATLNNTATGGGVPSYAATIHGGFTIANGVIIENASGGSGNDNITGNAFANILSGNAGNDILNGQGDNDRLNGGIGNDTLNGGFGNDRMDGGSGNDTIIVNSTGDLVLGGAGIDTLRSTVSRTLGSGSEKLVLLGSSHIGGNGNSVANTITGNSGVNRINGNGNNDILNGNGNRDFLNGGTGNDTILGGAGNDIITGGLGKDTLTGHAGLDDFDFNSISESRVGSLRDTINAFQRGVDDIDLRSIDANTRLSGNQSFIFIGTDGFDRTDRVFAELRYTDLGSRCIVQGDVNNDGRADFEILVKATSLARSDFLV